MNFYNSVREKLGHRVGGFDYIFNYLKNIKDPLIVETGCCRGDDNYLGDGESSVLFDNYIAEYGGEFLTVDLSDVSFNYCKSKLISPKSSVTLSDSVCFLHKLNKRLQEENRKIDFLYLDSYDASSDNVEILQNSARHHIYELLAIMPSLKIGSLIGVDDNWIEITRKCVANNPNWTVSEDIAAVRGKGMYINEYMNKIGIESCFANYQFFWINK